MTQEADQPVKKARRYPVLLFHIPGWPSQDPNRRMVWRIYFDGEPKALRDLKRLSRRLRKEAVFELQHMSTAEAKKIRTKGYLLRDFKAREQALRDVDAAS